MRGLNIALDSIAEFRVSTAVYTAETGAAGGAQISVVSKSGSNDYHGSTFYAVRNDALDARSPFDGSTLPPFTLNQFGASFGGAIVKNKAFFYANYEGLRQSLGQTFINFVPNAAFRAQVLATIARAGAHCERLPQGNRPHRQHHRPGHQRGHRYRSRRCRHVPLRLPVQRQHHRVRPLQRRQRLHRQPHRRPGRPQRDTLVPTNVVLQFQHIFSPTTVDEAKFGMNRANYHNWGYGTSPVVVSVSALRRSERHLARYRSRHHVQLHQQPDHGARPSHAQGWRGGPPHPAE
jgi:hypothetical protein